MSAVFGVNGDGNRVMQMTTSGTYSYVNDVNTSLPVVLSEQGPDGNITYGYGLNLIEEYSPSFNYFYHYDGLGSVVALTDATGLPAAAYAYDPWGNSLLPDLVGTRNKFRFTGQALDPGTGPLYLRARYYGSGVGRFIAQDSLNGFSALPQSQNRYAYVLNSPLRFVDPSGKSAIDAESYGYSNRRSQRSRLTAGHNAFHPRLQLQTYPQRRYLGQAPYL
jgi:RHS repeat-associated protein